MSASGLGDCQPNGVLTATPKCGLPPYSYQWFTVDYSTPGSGWIPTGTAANQPISITITSGFGSQAYKVNVTDANGNTATKTGFEYSFCTYLEPADPNSAKNPKSAISISPNPAHKRVDLNLLLDDDGIIDVKIYDMNGIKKATVFHGQTMNGALNLSVPLDGYVRGAYIIKVSGKKTNINRKLFVR